MISRLALHIVALSFLFMSLSGAAHAQAPTKVRTYMTEKDSAEEIVDRSNLKGPDRFRGFYPFKANPRLPEGVVQDISISRRPLKPAPSLPGSDSSALQSPQIQQSLVPYKNDVLRVVRSLIPKSLQQPDNTLLLVIDKGGKASKVEFTSTNQQSTPALWLQTKTKETIVATIFPPLPEGYENEALPFCIPLNTMDKPFSQDINWWNNGLKQVKKSPAVPHPRYQGAPDHDTRERIIDISKLHGPDRFRGPQFDHPSTLPPGAILDAPLLPPGRHSMISGVPFSGAIGKIAPYRKDLFLRLHAALPTNLKLENPKNESSELLLTIAPDGSLLKVEFSDELENKMLRENFKKQLLKAIYNVQFAPLPSWYRGSSLTIKILIRDFDQPESSRSTKDHSLGKQK